MNPMTQLTELKVTPELAELREKAEKLRLAHANAEAEVATMERELVDEWAKRVGPEILDALRAVWIKAFTMRRESSS